MAIKKLILGFIALGILALGFYYPAPVAKATDGGAGWVYNALWGTKEFGLDTAARFLARGLLKVTINTVIKKIQTAGREGRSPSFVQEWRNFLTQGQYRGESIFRSILANTEFCVDFGNNVRMNFGVSSDTVSRLLRNTRTNNFDPFTLRARCTMPQGWTLDNYRGDFNGRGGYSALLRLSEPQNNGYGALLMTLAEASNQRDLEQWADQAEAQAGSGYTGIRRSLSGRGSCDDPRPSSPGGQRCVIPTGSYFGTCSGSGVQCTRDETCRGGDPSTARCTFLGFTTTPGQLLGETAANAIDSNIGWLITSDEVSEVIVAIIYAVIDRLDDYTQPIRDDALARQGMRPPVTTDPYTACVDKCNRKPQDEIAACINRCSIIGPGTGTELAGPVEATLYTDPNYGGPKETFTSGDGDLSDNVSIRDNTASSLKVSSPYTIAILCEDKGTAGFVDRLLGNNCRAFTQDVPRLPSAIDNKVSYIDILPGNSVTLCPEDNFVSKEGGEAKDGYCESFYAGEEDPDLRDNEINNDTATSILVPLGWSVTLYQNTNYQGGSVTFTASSEDFQAYAFQRGMDNKASSIKVSAAPPPPTPTPTPGPPVCSDGIDNDGDGLIDLADPNCNNDPNGTYEGGGGGGGGGPTPTPIIYTPTPTPAPGFLTECNDGVDNDRDGLIDLVDPDCNNDPSGPSESFIIP